MWSTITNPSMKRDMNQIRLAKKSLFLWIKRDLLLVAIDFESTSSCWVHLDELWPHESANFRSLSQKKTRVQGGGYLSGNRSTEEVLLFYTVTLCSHRYILSSWLMDDKTNETEQLLIFFFTNSQAHSSLQRLLNVMVHITHKQQTSSYLAKVSCSVK